MSENDEEFYGDPYRMSTDFHNASARFAPGGFPGTGEANNDMLYTGGEGFSYHETSDTDNNTSPRSSRSRIPWTSLTTLLGRRSQ